MESNLQRNVTPTSLTLSGLIMVDSKIFEIPNDQGSTEWTSYGKLFAMGLPFDTKEIHIIRHFEQFGPIRRVEMSKSHPEYCFVIYEKRKGLVFALRQKVHFITTNSRNSFKTIIVKSVSKSKKFEAAINANCKITTVKKEENSDKKKTEEKIRKEAFEALEKLKNAIETQKIQQNIKRQDNWKNRIDFLYSLRYSPLSKISPANNRNLESILIKSGIPLRISFTSDHYCKLQMQIKNVNPIDTNESILDGNETTTIENAIEPSPDFEETAPIDIIEAGDGVLEINGETDPINSTIHADDILDLDDEDEHHITDSVIQSLVVLNRIWNIFFSNHLLK